MVGRALEMRANTANEDVSSEFMLVWRAWNSGLEGG